jgi:hypothetical protein
MSLQQRQDAMRSRLKTSTLPTKAQQVDERVFPSDRGHSSGHSDYETGHRPSPDKRTLDVESVAPAVRLLDLKASGAYLGVSYWTMRDLVSGGVIPCVKIPCLGGRDLRRILIDRRDLDAFIDRNKELQ